MQKYINAHCHLQNFNNVAQVLQNAEFVGIYGFISDAASVNDWEKLLELKKKYENVHVGIGIHPWYINEYSESVLEYMRNILKNNPDIMVGEIGLDKYKADIKKQESIFETQLGLACEFNRSVHIHCVGAWDRLLHILKGLREKVPHLMVLHGFAGSVEISRSLLREYNVFFSFSPVINNWKSRLNVIKEMPLDRVLVESDDANPDVILEVVKKIAEVLGLSVAQVADAIYDNSQRFLKDGQAA